MEKNMAMEKGQAVLKPIATVPIMAMGMRRSGWWISSAMWVAQSRQAKAQLVLMRPTMKAIPLEAQPVLLTKLAKTNCAVSLEIIRRGF
jgi:hypothetical protein